MLLQCIASTFHLVISLVLVICKEEVVLILKNSRKVHLKLGYKQGFLVKTNYRTSIFHMAIG